MIPFVYTATAGNYPIVRKDIKCFNGEGLFTRPEMDAKRYKVLPHLYCPDHEITIWTDANIWLQAKPEDIAKRYLGPADMALFSHPVRETVWQEFYALTVEERFHIPWLQQQLADQQDRYRAQALPEGTRLYECNVLIRRRSDKMARLMDAWWAELTRWQWRDQVSLPYVLWRYGSGLKVNALTGNVRDHPDFRYVPHH